MSLNFVKILIIYEKSSKTYQKSPEMSFSLRIFETMSFVNPAFLIALSAIAIPIIIHLIQLRKYKKIYFSNVSFLHSIEEQQRKTNKLKNLLVLLARILTIIFLVLAFAQPYIPVNNEKVNTGKNYVSIYIDNSFSMERQGANGTLLDEAKRKAKEVAQSFKSNDQFQLLGNEFSGNQQRWLSKESFLKNVAELKTRPESRNLQQVSARQKSFLKEKSGKSAKAFIISDFQESFIGNQIVDKLDSSIDWQLITLENSKNQNISIDSVWFYSPIHFPNSQENLLIRVHNYSESEVTAFPYEIRLNGQVIGVGNINIPAESYVVDTFIYKNKNTGWQEGMISIKDQSLSFDNDYYFSYEIEHSRNISIVQGSEASNFVQAVYNTEPFFNTKVFNYQQIDFNFIDQSQIIILNEVDEISSGLFSQLQKALKKSAVIVCFPSLKSEIKTNDFYSKLGLSSMLPLLKSKEKIEKVNYNNELFEGIFLKQNNASLDLPTVLAYYPFSKSGRLPEVMLSLSNGQSVLNKYTVEKGVVYQFAMPLKTNVSDLPKHAIIVPLLLRIGTIHDKSDAIAYFIGENSSIAIPGLKIDERIKNELSMGAFSIVPEIKNVNGTDQIFVYDQLSNAGIYTLTQENKELAKIAFNSSRKESDLTALSSSKIDDLLGGSVKIWKTGDASLSSLVKEEAFGRRLWKICVILALFFMALEILFIRNKNKHIQ